MSKSGRKSWKKSSVSFEPLENRQLMAADVAAYIQNNALFIAESAGDPGGQNGVQIMEIAPGTMRVTGLQTDDGGVSSVNGHTSQDFSGIVSLFVNLGGGNDRVVVGDLSSQPSTTHLDSVYIDVDGTNQPNAYGFDFDKVTVENLVTTGILDISTGIGNDVITVGDSVIGNDDLDNLNVHSGGGSDSVILDNVDVKGNVALFSADNTSTAADSDKISLQTVTAHNGIQVEMGSGNDSLTATDVTSTSDILFDLGAGNDTANLNSVRAAGDFSTKMGDGDDTLQVTFLGANRLTLDGGNGTDSLTTGIDGQVNLLSEVNWESINGQPPPTFTHFNNRNYVVAVYGDVLDRAPDPGGLSYWTQLLDSGTAVSSVAKSIAHSGEYYANFVIKPAYLSLLGRTGQDAEVSQWTNSMQNGLTDQQLEAALVASDEFYGNAGGTNTGWIDAVYTRLLQRTAEPSGETYWNNQLSAGASRGDVALRMANSAENDTQLINDDYFHYLGRAADASGSAFWLQQFSTGQTNEDVIAGFTGSPEYYAGHTS